jgi:cation transport ATPase
VRAGESSVNEASITGESMPVDKREGSMVYAGTINGEGSLEVLSSRTAEDTTISRIVAMVENAQAKKAMSQRLVDTFAKYWTPAMMALSAVAALVVPLALGEPSARGSTGPHGPYCVVSVFPGDLHSCDCCRRHCSRRQKRSAGKGRHPSRGTGQG